MKVSKAIVFPLISFAACFVTANGDINKKSSKDVIQTEKDGIVSVEHSHLRRGSSRIEQSGNSHRDTLLNCGLATVCLDDDWCFGNCQDQGRVSCIDKRCQNPLSCSLEAGPGVVRVKKGVVTLTTAGLLRAAQFTVRQADAEVCDDVTCYPINVSCVSGNCTLTEEPFGVEVGYLDLGLKKFKLSFNVLTEEYGGLTCTDGAQVTVIP